ncbi:MAG: hypothetical protein U9Q69_03985 [Nanoarchaeota archaeon]|nr:hypothetical protein [Nanoarchaeota archaeon]
MKEICQGFHSKYSKKDTLDILLNRMQDKRINALDLDGTLHKGINKFKYRGISNVDLAFAVALKLFYKRPNKFFGFCRGCLRTRSFEKKLDGSNINKEKLFIEYFFENALMGLPYTLVREASKNLDKLAYPGAKESVQLLSGVSEFTQIITKSYFISLEPYLKWFRGKGLNIGCFSNHFWVKDGEIVGLEAYVTDKNDKYNLICNQYLPFDSSFVFGDTDDDAVMKDAFNKKGIKSYMFAVDPKQGLSSNLMQKADFLLENWLGFYSLLSQNLY